MPPSYYDAIMNMIIISFMNYRGYMYYYSWLMPFAVLAIAAALSVVRRSLCALIKSEFSLLGLAKSEVLNGNRSETQPTLTSKPPLIKFFEFSCHKSPPERDRLNLRRSKVRGHGPRGGARVPGPGSKAFRDADVSRARARAHAHPSKCTPLVKFLFAPSQQPLWAARACPRPPTRP